MTPALVRPLLIVVCFAVSGGILPMPGNPRELAGTVLADSVLTDSATLQFDMPPLAQARPVSSQLSQSIADMMPGENLVSCELNLSSMIASPRMPQIDQVLVQCQPRDESLMISDYGPRTELASDVAGPIQVKELDEQTASSGLSIDGSYGHAARGSFGADRGSKNSDTIQYSRIAPVQAVTASGTINRGRGVYFKLRWTATQVLEGEKKFVLTFRVPAGWRSSLIDVSVAAQSHRRPSAWDAFGSRDDEVETIGSAHFVVAAYRSGDREAAVAAQTLAEAEQRLRKVAATVSPTAKAVDSVPAMLRHVVRKFDKQPEVKTTSWVDRLIVRNADPYFDKQISRLPVDVRVAALDYVDARDEFASLQ